ncbi:hypothetical protein FDECE_2061 [Fusarium decemcellulare]|nr:hypothetical protein FDECE_2061 [Fusarium decemcellulare]
MMRAVQVIGDMTSPKVVTNPSIAKPIPRNSEILVQVYAAGITGDEVLWPELYDTPSRIPGHDISGVIAGFGPDYDGPLKVGQEIIALIAAERGEGQADYAICFAEEVALKPASVSHAEAAALPIPLLTAWESVLDHGKVKSGMKVLVTGASGAVGILLVQIATQIAGANVVALAASRNHPALRQLGAHEVIDYNTTGWESIVTDVDVVLDTVGGGILAKTWETVKDDGAIVTVGDPPPPWAFGRGQATEATRHPGVRYLHFIVSPNATRLEKVLDMIDRGRVEALAVKSFPFHEAAQAWMYAQQRNRGHKVVIDFRNGRS